jgi:hypothetical protein
MRRVASELRRAISQYHKNQAISHNQNSRKFWYDYNQIEPEHTPIMAGLCDEKTGQQIADNDLPEKINT